MGEEIEFLTVSDVAGRLGYSERTIRDYIKSGRIRARKFGERGSWRIVLGA